jgi:methylamine--corrinoid protein Co-methyltransferase
VEMGIAAAEKNRVQANELVLGLLEKYEARIDKAPQGSRYQECYDVLTGKPGVAYLRLYDELKDELSRMGMVFA